MSGLYPSPPDPLSPKRGEGEKTHGDLSVFQVLRRACGPSTESAKDLRLLTKLLALFLYKRSAAGQLHICRPTIKFHGGFWFLGSPLSDGI